MLTCLYVGMPFTKMRVCYKRGLAQHRYGLKIGNSIATTKDAVKTNLISPVLLVMSFTSAEENL